MHGNAGPDAFTPCITATAPHMKDWQIHARAAAVRLMPDQQQHLFQMALVYLSKHQQRPHVRCQLPHKPCATQMPGDSAWTSGICVRLGLQHQPVAQSQSLLSEWGAFPPTCVVYVALNIAFIASCMGRKAVQFPSHARRRAMLPCWGLAGQYMAPSAKN